MRDGNEFDIVDSTRDFEVVSLPMRDGNRQQLSRGIGAIELLAYL